MLNRVFALLLIGCILGCAVLSKGGHGQRAGFMPSKSPGAKAGDLAGVVPARHTPPLKKAASFGIVFGKTDFRGLLKAAYARLTIIDRADTSRVYYFYVGQKANQNLLPWGKGEVIEPGYFFLQLPPGKYAVASIAIPVGSTIAEETLALDLDVSADKTFYLGTLEVDGIKERAKFGGVPLVKPGFEYSMNIKDEFEAAKNDFERLLPRHDVPVIKKLFEIK